MTQTLKAVPPAVATHPEPAQAPIDSAGMLTLVLMLCERVRALEAEKERLLIALRREAHHIDKRAPHSGR